jgi:nitrate/nitrite transporter NarK
VLVVTTLGYIGCFAVWTIFAIVGIEIQRKYGLSDAEFGLLVGAPFLSGSLMRVVLGVWADRHGGRRLFLGVMVIAAIATWFVADATTYPSIAAMQRDRSATDARRAGHRKLARLKCGFGYDLLTACLGDGWVCD